MREVHYDYMMRRMRELDDEIPAKYPQRKKLITSMTNQNCLMILKII